MKLYVWEGVLTDYTDGIMFALASSVEEAREQIRNAHRKLWNSEPYFEADLAKVPDEYDSPVGFYLHGGG